MKITPKLLKQITETKYLATENTPRYRAILRYFYEQYEKIKYWIYKEEIHEQLKEYIDFESYTIEQCEQDLEALVVWKNLSKMQDTSNVSTIEEFKNRKFRYQLTEYSVEIERMVIKLENLLIESASLEPKLFERLRTEIQRINTIIQEKPSDVVYWWENLNSDFKRLNQNYQDFLRTFYEAKVEEIMKTHEFLVYKNDLVQYIREFIKELQQNAYIIEKVINDVTEETVNLLMDKIVENEKSIPRLGVDFDGQMVLELNQSKWINIKNWFVGTKEAQSESVRLFETTNEIIRKITKYAAQIAESKGNATNRKEEYKRICELFCKCQTLDEANRLSSLVFGVFNTKHIQGNIIRTTDSANSSVYSEQPLEIEIKPRIRDYKNKMPRNAIEDKSEQKKDMYLQYLEQQQNEQQELEQYIQDDMIDLANHNRLPKAVRTTLLKLISKASYTQARAGKTDFGLSYRLIYPENNKRCTIQFDDGTLEMPAFKIEFQKAEEL